MYMYACVLYLLISVSCHITGISLKSPMSPEPLAPLPISSSEPSEATWKSECDKSPLGEKWD